MYKLFNEWHPEIRIEYSSISNTAWIRCIDGRGQETRREDPQGPRNQEGLSYTFLINSVKFPELAVEQGLNRGTLL